VEPGDFLEPYHKCDGLVVVKEVENFGRDGPADEDQGVGVGDAADFFVDGARHEGLEGRARQGVGAVDEGLDDEAVDMKTEFGWQTEEGGAGSVEECRGDWRKAEGLHLIE